MAYRRAVLATAILVTATVLAALPTAQGVTVTIYPSFTQSPPHPSGKPQYDTQCPTPFNPSETKFAVNRCPVAVLDKDFRTLENCAGTACQCPNGVFVTLDATHSYDPDGDSLFYRWVFIGSDPNIGFTPVSCQGSAPEALQFAPPTLDPTMPAQVVLHFGLQVADRKSTTAGDVRVSQPAFINVTVLNSDQGPVFVTGGKAENAITAECLPRVPVEDACVRESSKLSAGEPRLHSLDIVGDRDHTLQVGTGLIQDDVEVASVEAWFVNPVNNNVDLRVPLQLDRTKDTLGEQSGQSSTYWKDLLVRNAQTVAGLPVRTHDLLAVNYDIILVVHDAQGRVITTEPGTYTLSASSTITPINLQAGLFGVTPLQTAVPNRCFPGETRIPAQAIGPGQTLRINVTGPDSDEFGSFHDPQMLVWKVTTQVCSIQPNPNYPRETNRDIALVGRETRLTEPYLLKQDNLEHGAQEVLVRAYDREMRVTEFVVPIAVAPDPPKAMVVAPAITYVNVTFPFDVLTHDVVDQSVTLTVQNMSLEGGVRKSIQLRQSSATVGANAILAHVPNLESAVPRDVTGDGLADFLLDLDGSDGFDHFYDHATHASGRILAARQPQTRFILYTVDLNGNGRADDGEPTLLADQDGALYSAKPFVGLGGKCTAGGKAQEDVNKDGIQDTVEDTDGDCFPDQYTSPTAPAGAVARPLVPQARFTAKFQDRIDVDGDGRLDTVFDTDGDGVPESYQAADGTFGTITESKGIWTWTNNQRGGTYDPAKRGQTVLGFMHDAPTDWFRFDLRRNLTGLARWGIFVDDVVGNGIYQSGLLRTIRATADASAVSLSIREVAEGTRVLTGDAINLTAEVRLTSQAGNDLPPLPVRVFFDGKEGTSCQVDGGGAAAYPIEVQPGGPTNKACMPGSSATIYGVGPHKVTARVRIANGINDTNPSNNDATAEFTVYLGMVLDGSDQYYILGDSRGLPQLSGGAVLYPANGPSKNFDLKPELQSDGSTVYRFTTQAAQTDAQGNTVAAAKTLFWDPVRRAHKDGSQPWNPLDKDTNESDCRPGKIREDGTVDAQCRPVTVASAPDAPAGTSNSSSRGSPAAGLSLVVVLGAVAVALRRRRA